jgi:short-subunit dehydrogenase
VRVVVVGASTGLGRCLGVGLAQRGADVALLARREELVSTSRGLLTDKLMDVEHFIDAVAGVLRCGATACIPTVAVTPRRPI